MPDNDPVSNAPHLHSRLAVGTGSHPPRIGQDETSSALALEQLILDGDLGAVSLFLHEAEHHLGPFRPDPWALLEHLATQAIRRRQEPEGTGETAPAETPGESAHAAAPFPVFLAAPGSEGSGEPGEPG